MSDGFRRFERFDKGKGKGTAESANTRFLYDKEHSHTVDHINTSQDHDSNDTMSSALSKLQSADLQEFINGAAEIDKLLGDQDSKHQFKQELKILKLTYIIPIHSK